MDKNLYSLYNLVQQTYCDNCADKEYCSKECGTHDVLNAIRHLEDITIDGNPEGCHVCTDKNGKIKDVFYDTGRGGFSFASYCPNCGKKLK